MMKIKMMKKEFTKTPSGRQWKKNPDKIEETEITEREYSNFVGSIHFFNNFGNSARCRGYKSYTKYGYAVTKIVTVSPFEEIKTVHEFTLD